jgi:hypothetical protein
MSIRIASGRRSVHIASPEDTVLQKLAWYRRGNEVSSRQWDDLLGVLKVSRKDLDLDYLTLWAPHLEVADLLVEALHDAGIDPPP